jgi:hypothetical protein
MYFCHGGTWHEAQTWEDKKCVDTPQLMQHKVTNFQTFEIKKKKSEVKKKTFQNTA